MSLRKLTIGAVAATALAAALAQAAQAAPQVDGEFALSGKPGHLALGSDGNVWVVMSDSANEVARVAPDGTVTEYDVANLSGAVDIASDPDGNFWVTQVAKVTRFAPANPAGATQFPAADIADPRGIALGSDGNMWAASGDKVVRITTAGVTTTFAPTGLVGSRGIAAGGDGKLYVADFGGKQIVGVKTDGTADALYPAAAGGGPMEVAAGAANQIGFTDPIANPQQVGRLAPGNTTTSRIDSPGDPFGIAFGADGAYWIANFAGQSLTRMTADGQLTTLGGFTDPTPGPRQITAGPGNTLWVGLETAKKVARVSGVEPPAAADPAEPRITPVNPAPVVSRLALSGKRVVQGRKATFRYRLSESASVQVRIERAAKGKQRGKKCVTPTRALRKKRGCTRYVHVISLRASGKQGDNKLVLSRSVSKRLVPGRYRLTLTAVDAGRKTSKPVAIRFVAATVKLKA